MNPITRMMKRYIKTPLKYALPLLFIGALVFVSISGCTSSTSNPTATPSAAPTSKYYCEQHLKERTDRHRERRARLRAEN